MKWKFNKDERNLFIENFFHNHEIENIDQDMISALNSTKNIVTKLCVTNWSVRQKTDIIPWSNCPVHCSVILRTLLMWESSFPGPMVVRTPVTGVGLYFPED